MSLSKEFTRFISVVTIFSFLTQCVAYNATILEPENVATANKRRAIVHWQNAAYVFRNISINETIFEGIVGVSLRNYRGYSKEKFLHIYIEKELNEKLQTGLNLSLPVADIDQIVTYEVDKNKTTQQSLLIAAPFVLLIALFIYMQSQGSYGLNLSGDPTGLSGDGDF